MTLSVQGAIGSTLAQVTVCTSTIQFVLDRFALGERAVALSTADMGFLVFGTCCIRDRRENRSPTRIPPILRES